jgi:uracil phosphoribosyltransferase
VKNIRLLVVLGSKIGLDHVQKEFPDLEVSHLYIRSHNLLLTRYQIWAAAVDNVLTHDGLISPGLGDAVRYQIMLFIELKLTGVLRVTAFIIRFSRIEDVKGSK